MKRITKGRITVVKDGAYAGEYGPGFVLGVTRPGHCGHGAEIPTCPYCFPEEPQAEPGGQFNDTVETHPAYAQIGISRVSGGTRLYGSDFVHQHFMRLRIHRSELHRSLSNDWPHEREEYIEVDMSEGQWAELIASPNSGSGVQCTLVSRDGRAVSRLPDPKSRTDQFGDEVGRTMNRALAKLAELRERIAAGKVGKTNTLAMLSMLDKAVQEIQSNTGFVSEQFEEHMERTVSKAKVEIQAYVGREIASRGLASLADPKAMPLALPEPTIDCETEEVRDG